MKLQAPFLSSNYWCIERRLLSPPVTPCIGFLSFHLETEPVGFAGHVGAHQQMVLSSITRGFVTTFGSMARGRKGGMRHLRHASHGEWWWRILRQHDQMWKWGPHMEEGGGFRCTHELTDQNRLHPRPPASLGTFTWERNKFPSYLGLFTRDLLVCTLNNT